MRYQSWVVVFLTIGLGLLGWSWVEGQSMGVGSPSSTNTTDSSAPAPSGMASPSQITSPSTTQATASSGSLAQTPASTASTTSASDDDSDQPMQASDFVVNGVPSARVLYMEGNVWIRPAGEMTFHRLTEDEAIPEHSALYTGYNGILDFATGPGMAIRMTPKTGLRVDLLAQPATSSSEPIASKVSMRKGTIFSALGQEDGSPINFQVQTPLGVAGARGTMFSTTASPGQAQVSMLHGTVNFETPDHQTSQITAGQSQQIGSSGGRYNFGEHQALNPANSSEFFDHAGGLLEHATGYGVVRHGLGPDVARTLQEHGYKLPPETQQRFQNAGNVHYHHRPGSHAHDAAAGHTRTTEGEHPSRASEATTHRTAAEREEERRHLNDPEWKRHHLDKDGNEWGH